jgi:hypothetical protein
MNSFPEPNDFSEDEREKYGFQANPNLSEKTFI